MKIQELKGAYATIDLDCIVHNYKEACSLVEPHVLVSCVVKSDAYGHGETQVVEALVENGLSFICVSTIMEAIRLRKQFPLIEILILGYTPQFLLHKVSEFNLIQTISSLEEAEILNQFKQSKIHIKVNTGMNRLGFHWEDYNGILKLSHFKNIEIAGIFSHLHSSDKKDKSWAELQFGRFNELVERLEENHFPTGMKHICNSGGIIDLKHMHLDMVREGIMLYGLSPSTELLNKNLNLKESMSYRSYISNITHLKKGEGVSYGHTFVADNNMTVATVNLGYSDGLFRSISNNGDVIIHNQRRRIIGTVCMNMFMVDITDMKDVHVEDEVIIFGRSEKESISIQEVASNAGTISYEIICRTGYSIPRVFIKHEEIIEIENNLLYKEKVLHKSVI